MGNKIIQGDVNISGALQINGQSVVMPLDMWNGWNTHDSPISDIIESQDPELLLNVLTAAQDQPFSFMDSRGHKYIVRLDSDLEEMPIVATFFVEPNTSVDPEDDLQIVEHSPVQTYHVSFEVDAETGDPRIAATLLSGTRYSTVDEVQSMINAAITNVLNEEF